MKHYLNIIKISLFMLFLTIGIGMASSKETFAETSLVEVKEIDYELLTMEVSRNGNNVVYYSTDKTNWLEVEGPIDSDNNYIMDISWISGTVDTTIYFKGDNATSFVSITVPKKNTLLKATFVKLEGTLQLQNIDESEIFQWRKVTDYEWQTVAVDEDYTPSGAKSYTSFIIALDLLRTKGAKIIVRIPQVNGIGIDNTGARPSNEVTVAIPARGAAPSIIVNSSKLTLNTTDKMEYSLNFGVTWLSCTKAMSIEQLASKSLYENGGNDVTVYIRTKETEKNPYSLWHVLMLTGQKEEPTVGDGNKDMSYYYINGNLILNFTKASISNAYEYAIVKPGVTFSVKNASWKKVTKSLNIKLTPKTAPKGSKIYFRVRGIDANISKKIELVLPSAYEILNVLYP